MDKTKIRRTCVVSLEKQIKDLLSAAKASASMATDEEHRARSKYDTFSLESSYLARGQARRVGEMREALSRLLAMPLRVLGAEDEVQMGALVEVVDPAGEYQVLWIVTAGGGEEVEEEGRSIQLVTLQSPIAQVLLKKKVGETVHFAKRPLRIASVA
jgi:transcription elongation GreA/GreB family factor